jgi:hypothetical protein
MGGLWSWVSKQIFGADSATRDALARQKSVRDSFAQRGYAHARVLDRAQNGNLFRVDVSSRDSRISDRAATDAPMTCTWVGSA